MKIENLHACITSKQYYWRIVSCQLVLWVEYATSSLFSCTYCLLSCKRSKKISRVEFDTQWNIKESEGWDAETYKYIAVHRVYSSQRAVRCLPKSIYYVTSTQRTCFHRLRRLGLWTLYVGLPIVGKIAQRTGILIKQRKSQKNLTKYNFVCFQKLSACLVVNYDRGWKRCVPGRSSNVKRNKNNLRTPIRSLSPSSRRFQTHNHPKTKWLVFFLLYLSSFEEICWKWIFFWCLNGNNPDEKY